VLLLFIPVTGLASQFGGAFDAQPVGREHLIELLPVDAKFLLEDAPGHADRWVRSRLFGDLVEAASNGIIRLLSLPVEPPSEIKDGRHARLVSRCEQAI